MYIHIHIYIYTLLHLWHIFVPSNFVVLKTALSIDRWIFPFRRRRSMEMSTSLRPGRGGAAGDLGQLPGTRLGVAVERSASVDMGRSTVWVGKTWEIHGKMVGKCR